MKTIRIATRESPLALWQAHHVEDLIKKNFPEIAVEIKGFTTQGDRLLNQSLAKVGGKGLFVKELEMAILNGEADIAVHSMKDVPMEFMEGLSLAAICERAEPRDALVTHRPESLDDFPAQSIIGTSSLRRSCQIKARFPELEIKLLRGNVNSRLAKLDNGEYDAIILAAVGLQRLGFEDRIREYFSLDDSIPAPGQGAIGVECRSDDVELQTLLKRLNHDHTVLCLRAERELSRQLGGNCSVPIGAFAEISGEKMHLRVMVGAPDGSRVLRAALSGAINQPEDLGQKASRELLALGAAELLARL